MTSVEYRRSADPQAYFRELRRRGALDTAEGFEGRVQVLEQREGERLLRDFETFSSGMEGSDHGSARPVIPLQVDPPAHARYRKLLEPVFSARAVGALEPDVIELTDQLISRFASRGRCDFSQELSVPLPSALFLRQLGLPWEGLDGLLRVKDGVLRAGGATPDERAGVRRRAATEVYDLFERALQERAAEPRDDLLTGLLRAEADGERLSLEEVLDVCFGLFLAGLDTVSISLQCIFHYLATHAEPRRRLAADPSLASSVVEELLRWESPVQGLTRVATGDVEVDGRSFPAGTRFQVMLGSINTDPHTAPGYGEVDFDRGTNRHVAFGIGPHRCIGSHLARLELRTVVSEWHRRIPEYELEPGGTVVWNGALLRGVDHLQLVWERG